jgi:MFS family permease
VDRQRYVLAYAMLLLTAGRLADVFGRRRIFLIGVAAFTAASLAAGLAQTATELIAARIVQGLGAALPTPPTLAILNHTFREPKTRGTAIGIWGAVAALGFAVGPIAGGLITEHLHWMWIFFVNGPVGAAAIAVGMRVIPESTDPGTSRRLDLAGLTTSAIALSALTYALLTASERGWGSPLIVPARHRRRRDGGLRGRRTAQHGARRRLAALQNRRSVARTSPSSRSTSERSASSSTPPCTSRTCSDTRP